MTEERLAARLDDAYDHEELAASLAVIERRLRRRRTVRRGVAISVAGAAMAIVIFALGRDAPPAPLTLEDGRPVAALTSSASATAQLSDGSTIALASDAHIDEVEQTERAIVLRLASGSARFDVRPHGDREWSVVAGPLTVRVLGTAFTVTRDRAHASVTVHRGVVAVETGAESRRLYAGERFEVGTIEPAMRDPLAVTEPIVGPAIDVRAAGGMHESAAETSPERAIAEHLIPEQPARTTDETSPDRAIAERVAPAQPTHVAAALDPPPAHPSADPSAAPSASVATAGSTALPGASGLAPPPMPDTVEVLLARADHARREGRADEAIDALTAIIGEHPSAPEAPSAAVTLAQLEERRGHLERAALAYRRALALGPPPSLAELCYERLVRIHLARNDRGGALDARAEHRRRFPRGARAGAIDALLDAP